MSESGVVVGGEVKEVKDVEASLKRTLVLSIVVVEKRRGGGAVVEIEYVFVVVVVGGRCMGWLYSMVCL